MLYVIQVMLTACEKDQDGTGLVLREPNQFRPDPARKLSANLYDIQPFRTVPLSIIRSFSLFTQQWLYVIQVC